MKDKVGVFVGTDVVGDFEGAEVGNTECVGWREG
jgi:hypothetical protein